MSHLQTTSVDRYGEHLRRHQREKEETRKKEKEEEDPAVEEDLVASVDKSKEFTQKVLRLLFVFLVLFLCHLICPSLLFP